MNMYDLCRRAAAESAVLLKNDNSLLPLEKGTKVALFGRIQTMYYKCGTGSGGRVNIAKQPHLLTSLRANTDIVIDEELASVYEKWIEEHPFNNGKGMWAGEPWYQEEMPLEDGTVKAASEKNDVAVIFIGRSAGEDHDNGNEKGGYRLTDDEENMFALVSKYFKKIVVALNVGNIIDLSFEKRYENITSILYLFHGGMAGADAFSDLLSGKSAPSGKLPDTQAKTIEANPSHANFGASDMNIYAEDIYVGYRYFETFDRDSVDYPFGFGLTYTQFDISSTVSEDNGVITVKANVKNIGNRAGREVVQVYFKAPCGRLGQPSRQLVAFKKTADIAPNEREEVVISFNVSEMASYDDGGVTGNKSCFVLENGNYEIYVGNCVRSASLSYTYVQNETLVTERCHEALAPVTPFKRLVAKEENGVTVKAYEDTPLCTVDVMARIAENRPDDIPFTGDKGIKLPDVKDGKNTIDEFVAQLTDEQLAALVCGEGSDSPKATPGTVGALGGQSVDLDAYGIPTCCVADGPSGIRFEGGKLATLLPIGTLLAASFDPELVEALYSGVGLELKEGEVDSLLGPGINIHRHPLCGRNFEYYSEDPVLTGKIAAAATRGIGKYGCYATIKHFCANNQEAYRTVADSVLSERALREIYIKAFRIAIEEGKNVLIMTSYNPINGWWAASNYDLNTTILRKEWGFDNFVMTDWWASLNLKRGNEWTKDYLQAMVRAGNDVYMVCKDACSKSFSVIDGLCDGTITRGELQRNVKNILTWITKSPTFESYVQRGCTPKYPLTDDTNELNKVVSYLNDIVSGDVYRTPVQGGKKALVEFQVTSKSDILSQNPVSFKMGSVEINFNVEGGSGEMMRILRTVDVPENCEKAAVLTFPECIEIKLLIIKQ